MDNSGNILDSLVPISDASAVLTEITELAALITVGTDLELIQKAYADVQSLFTGTYPGYRASNTKYHDFPHTAAVALATVRLMHGAMENGELWNGKTVTQAIIAALFHDTGLIQTSDDTEGTGAKYTVGHEERSIALLTDYFSNMKVSKGFIESCAAITRTTDLSRVPDDIEYSSERVKLAAKIVASADLLAQMADRMYLEKLLLLYQEFEEAGIPGVSSELELLKNTDGFYKHVAKARLEKDLGHVSWHMEKHFETRHGIAKDLYDASIQNNIDYLRQIIQDHEDDYRARLRRGTKPPRK